MLQGHAPHILAQWHQPTPRRALPLLWHACPFRDSEAMRRARCRSRLSVHSGAARSRPSRTGFSEDPDPGLPPHIRQHAPLAAILRDETPKLPGSKIPLYHTNNFGNTSALSSSACPRAASFEPERPRSCETSSSDLQRLDASTPFCRTYVLTCTGCTEPVTHILDRSCRPRRPEASGLRVSPAPADKENTSRALQC